MYLYCIYAINRDRGETWNTSGKPRAVAWLDKRTAQHWKTRAKDNAPEGGSNCAARARPTWNTLKHCETIDRDCSIALHLTNLLAVGEAMAIVLVCHLSSGHDRSQCTTTKDRSRKRAVMAALWSFLLDRLDVERSILRFPSLLHASEGALRILAKGNWKIESIFLWGGRFGRSLLCPGRAEKETRGSWATTGCLPVDRNKLGPDSWRDEKGIWDRSHTHRQRHTRAHTHTQLKRRGPPGPRRWRARDTQQE